MQAAAADLAAANSTYARTQDLAASRSRPRRTWIRPRAAADAAHAKLDALKKQVEAQRARWPWPGPTPLRVDVRRSQVQAMQHSQAAAAAQRSKADVRLAYAEIHAPIDGQVDVRAVRAGEYVAAGQPVCDLVNPDDLWVRADVEEELHRAVRIGDTLGVRLLPGPSVRASVFYRGVDAAYATQRDVSRTKRDIKTFEVPRLRPDNKDRALPWACDVLRVPARALASPCLPSTSAASSRSSATSRPSAA